jgi:hypothetical protein
VLARTGPQFACQVMVANERVFDLDASGKRLGNKV